MPALRRHDDGRAAGRVTQRDGLVEFNAVPVKPDMDKLRRASAWSGIVESGRVYFGPGQHELMNALLSVPPQHAADASLWDLVDACGIVIR